MNLSFKSKQTVKLRYSQWGRFCLAFTRPGVQSSGLEDDKQKTLLQVLLSMESHHFWDRSRKMNSQASLNYTVRFLSQRVNKALRWLSR